MAYKIKSTAGRKSQNYKLRGIAGLTPKGFKFHRISHKHKAIIFKKAK